MVGRAVTLVGRCKVGRAWFRYPAAYEEGSDKVAAGVFLIKDKPVKVSEYLYELRYYEGGKTKYTPIGKSARGAESKRRKLKNDLRIASEAIASTWTELPTGAKGRLRKRIPTVSKGREDLQVQTVGGNVRAGMPNELTMADIPTRIETLDHLLSAKELAKTLNISPSALYRQCQVGSVPHLVLGGSIRFDPVAIANWLRGKAET